MMGSRRTSQATEVDRLGAGMHRSARGDIQRTGESGNVTLLIIDPQNDFHPGGSLPIPSADEDAQRIAAFIKKRGHEIDRIVITLDSHQHIHIAHSIFWVNEHGCNPPPFTIITKEDVASQKWRAADPARQRDAMLYAQRLEEGGRFQLCIWPEHCIIGSPGHNVRPVIQTAVDEWAKTRMKEVVFVWKGQNCLTEMYSALRAEVVVASDPRTDLNTELLHLLQESRRLYICGQALSHCVKCTVEDIVASYDPSRLETITILRDGTSPVPTFEHVGDAFLDDMQRRGLDVRLIQEDGASLHDGSAS